MLSVGDVQKVLQNLLREKVSIRHLEAILETLADMGRNQGPGYLTEVVRQKLGAAICQSLLGRQALQVLTLDPAIEQHLLQSVRSAEPGQRPRGSSRNTRSSCMRLVAAVRADDEGEHAAGAAVFAGAAAPPASRCRSAWVDAAPARAVDGRDSVIRLANFEVSNLSTMPAKAIKRRRPCCSVHNTLDLAQRCHSPRQRVPTRAAIKSTRNSSICKSNPLSSVALTDGVICPSSSREIDSFFHVSVH
jgi:hypothetical protein